MINQPQIDIEDDDPDFDPSLYQDLDDEPLTTDQQLKKEGLEQEEKKYLEEGENYPIQLDNLPYPDKLDKSLHWWENINFPNTFERRDIVKIPSNPEILNAKGDDIVQIKIKAWDNKNKDYVELSPKEYMEIRKKQYDNAYYKQLRNLNKNLNTLEREKIQLEEEISKSKAPKIQLDKKIMETLPAFVERVEQAWALIRDLDKDKKFKEWSKKRDNKGERLGDKYKSISSTYQELNEAATRYTSLLTAPSAGRARLSKKEVLNILKSKTPTSNSAIKQLDTEIFKILNS